MHPFINFMDLINTFHLHWFICETHLNQNIRNVYVQLINPYNTKLKKKQNTTFWIKHFCILKESKILIILKNCHFL